MMRIAKLLIVTLALLALPLRGYAGLAMAFCDSHPGASVAAQHDLHHDARDNATHEGAGPHQHEDSGGGSFASVCSICAACCVGSSAAPDAVKGLGALAQPAARIPFYDDPIVVVFGKLVDRPPLSPLR